MTLLEYFNQVVMACNVAQRRLDLQWADAVRRNDEGAKALVMAKWDVLLNLIAGLQDGIHARAMAENAERN
jgi:hypothetical protein